jgi:hypothetical protein
MVRICPVYNLQSGGGCHEKTISRKRSARRVELGNGGGVRSRKAGAGICTAAAPAPVYTWSGCYVGASAGSSSGTSQHYTTAGSILTNNGPVAGGNITDSFDVSGFIGGGQLGCNWQWGAWVFGIEGDGSATNKELQAFELLPGRGNWVSQTQERWLVTARGRLGLTGWWRQNDDLRHRRRRVGKDRHVGISRR